MLWNDIPEIIKYSADLNTFKRYLKTYIFKCYFNDNFFLFVTFFFLFTLIVKRLRAFGWGVIKIVNYYYY